KISLQEQYQATVHVFAADLTDKDDIDSLYKNIEERDIQVEILINNAGMGAWGFFDQSAWDKQERMIRLNIMALTYLTRLFLPSMISRHEGRILNVASTAAFQPGPLMAVYYATKAYVLSFSQALANELKDKGIRVTCLCPGPTDTDFQDRALIKDILLSRLGLQDPFAVAAYGYKAMMAGRPIAVHGNLNKLMAISTRFLPAPMTVSAVRRMMQE
ncbi:MAG: SDR family NAD(P)-dependent oxidoreductase, partial [Candidatus Omnitrophica bacterium]|nr:SDR family NAD(P)-dependent oxidoreductase [Candidatus Omnitrophota bacterium]